MPDCTTCPLFNVETQGGDCLHVNRPGGLLLTEQAVTLAGLPLRAKILDVGCGTSESLQFLTSQRRFIPIGMDLSLEMLLQGVELHPHLTRFQGMSALIPLPDLSLDAILTECTLSLAGNLEKTIQEFHQKIRPGGKLIVTDIYIREINDPGSSNYLAKTRCLAGAMTREKILHSLLMQGFEIKVWQDHTLELKKWMAGMVFKLGSLEAFYHRLSSCEEDSQSLSDTMGKKIKLGYYVLIAEKTAALN